MSGEPSISSAAATLRSIPSAKNAVDLFLRRAAVAFDRLIESGELLPDDLPDVLVTTCGVGLQLDAQKVAIGEEPHVGEAHQIEDRARSGSSSGPRLCRLVKDQAGSLEPVPDDGEEEFALRPEQLEQIRLRDTDRTRDRLGGGAAVAAVCEFSQARPRRWRRGARPPSGVVSDVAFMGVT